MNVLLFNGSPHQKGNTSAILNKIAEGAKSEGAAVKVIDLNKLDIKGCQGCYGCQQESSIGECVIIDEMKPLFNDVYNAEAIVIGSSIYMGQMTSQTKQFFDRFFAFIRPDFSSRLNNKKTALVFAHGQSDPNLYKSYIDHTAGAFNMMGFKVIDSIIGSGLYAPGMSEKNKGLMEKAFNLGQKLIKGV